MRGRGREDPPPRRRGRRRRGASTRPTRTPSGSRGSARARRGRAPAAIVVVARRRAAPDGLVVDRVLVDAPCSELGALRRGPDLRWRLDPAAFAPLPALQRAILERAARHVRPGGTLVYATCTFRREEDEDVALALEADHPELARVPPPVPAAVLTADGFLRTWPHRHGTDAFFAAAWRSGARAGEGGRRSRRRAYRSVLITAPFAAFVTRCA